MPQILPEKSYLEWKQEVDDLKAEVRALKDLRGFDHTLILAIQELLDGAVWEMSMLSQIADLLTDNGYQVEDRK